MIGKHILFVLFVIIMKNKSYFKIILFLFPKDNKMDAFNLATVFSPNLVHCDETRTRRPESIMFQMEWNNILIEKLIIHVDEIFANYKF